MSEIKYPEQYLHVRECQSGLEWIVPIRKNAVLDLDRLVRKWIKKEFIGELKLDGDVGRPGIEGDFYARIMTDGRSPDSAICWTSGGFYLTSTY